MIMIFIFLQHFVLPKGLFLICTQGFLISFFKVLVTFIFVCVNTTLLCKAIVSLAVTLYCSFYRCQIDALLENHYLVEEV